MVTEKMMKDIISQYDGTLSCDTIAKEFSSRKLNGESLSWKDISYIVYTLTGVYHSDKYYSKHYGSAQSVSDPYAESMSSSLSDKLMQIQLERAKLSDERTQNRAYIRRLAREETLKEIANDVVKTMNDKKELIFNPSSSIYESNKDKNAILMLSDWHYGIEIDSYWNKYNISIAKSRIQSLLNEVIVRCRREKVDVIHVLNLGDLIAGRIHLPIRLQSRVDTITQIIEVSELLAEFLIELRNNINTVYYYSCSDNHSRVEPDKTQSLDLESLCRITDWYLVSRLASTDIKFVPNVVSDDIITLNVLGHSIIAVHGDKDKPADAISKLSNFTRNIYEVVLMSHRHHFSADEECGTMVIGNGALMGTDQYAKSLRLHSAPSQTLIMSTAERVVDSIVRIVLQ